VRLAAVTMVRNEADIIESSLRHNLHVVDHVLVVDHASDDATPSIVQAMIAEGLPITLTSDASVTFQQGLRSSEGARWLFAERGADWVFPLDADELLKTPSREALEAGLGLVPAGLHLRVRLQSYVADSYADPAPFSVARFRRRLAAEAYPQMRVAIRRTFLERPSQVVTEGNHYVVDAAAPGQSPAYPAINAEVLAIAHFPIRSARQVVAKTILGWLAIAATHRGGNAAFHWRELYDELKRGRALDADRLMALAVNYGIPREAWRDPAAVELVEDPIAPTPPPRYAAAAALEPMQLLLIYAERLAMGARGA